MAGIPLSKFPEFLAAVERRAALISQIEHYGRIVSVAAFFEANGTEAQPLPASIIQPVRDFLTAEARQEIAAIDAQLVELGIDPQA
jgi:hypothetical protein